ncbi:leucine-rich repeat-containing protein 15-like [Pollicipes pollicipes]|uniref:leucine-rich repeat-containing protein 15-like n=1 Tax=Pollicipes pollicipes TaxID=41117 RepID=UPI001885426D|nr:leucine-rich repeat-containing protein 15-like [Pollicipes pollicipes]
MKLGIYRLQISLTEWGAEFPAQLFADVQPSVRELILDHNSFGVLPDTAFAGLRGTQIVRLDHNRLNEIGRLSRGQLAPLAQLRYLSLAGNGLQAVEQGALPPGIKHLSLYNNRLESLNGTLRNMNSMKWLFISKNRLTSLRDELPAGNSLRALTAYENRLTSLDGLQDARSLSRLFLRSNRLTSLGRLRLPLLKLLEVSDNQIETVTPEDFAGMPALKEVTLASNRLTEVGPILDVLRALDKLDLSDNGLISIGQLTSEDRQLGATEAAGDVPVLAHLYVRANRLTSLGELHLPKLRILDLSDNRLTQVSATNFVGLPSLRELILSGNHLEEVGLLLEVLPSLTKADFSDNIIRSMTPLNTREALPHEDKPQLVHLETLMLNNNSLSALHVALYRLPSLCVLDVRDNAISSLRWHRHHAWHCSLQRSKLRIRGNPMRCEDETVRRSLTSAAEQFSIDVALCDGVQEP